MPKEFYNQPLIEDPNLPDEDDRIGLGKPGQVGSRNVTWNYFKEILRSVLGVFNWIDMSPQNPAPDEEEGRFYYDDITKAFSFYTDVTGTPAARLSRVLRSRVLNNSGGLLAKGTVCKITGLSGLSPTVAPSQANNIDDVRKSFGMTLTDISDGAYGYLAVFDTLTGVNTAGMTANELIYLSPDTPGGFTDIEPQPPNYSLPIGFVAVVDAVNGALGVRFGGFEGSDTSTNAKGILNGVVTQSPQITFSVDGGVIYADVTNEEEPTKNLPFLIGDDRYLLDTTTNTGPGGAARVVVPPGLSDTEKETSEIYIYLDSGTPTLAVSTSTPAVTHCKLADVAVFNATRTAADGRPLSYRRFNNSVDSLAEGQPGGFGMLRYITDAIRFKLGSNWLSGQDATTTVNDTTIRIALSAGEGAQLHRSSLPSFDGLTYLIYNDDTNTPTYEEVDNLTSIVSTALGATLLSNNTHYTLRVYYQLNSNGIGNNVLVTRPLGKYTTLAEAIQDPLNYTVLLNDQDIEETIFPIYDLVISRTGSGGTTINLGLLRDLRSSLPTGAGGGGASSGGGTDDKVRISASDTTNDYLYAKLTEGSNISFTIENPGSTETLRIDAAQATADNGLTKTASNIQLGGDLLLQTEIDLKNNSLLFSNESDYAVGSSGFNSQIFSVKLFNNKYYVTGSFTTYDGTTVNRLAVFDIDGNLDTDFHTGNTGFNNNVNDSELLPNGSIVFVGTFTSYNGTAVNRIVAVSPDGTIDTSFSIGSGFNNTVNAIERQSDGKLVAGGGFTTYNGVSSDRLIRLNTDGSKDTGYSPSAFGGTPDNLKMLTDDSVVFLAQNLERFDNTGARESGWSGSSLTGTLEAVEFGGGKIYLGGNISQYGVDSIGYVARINLDGTLDTNYNPSGNTWTGTEVRDIKIVAGSNLMVVGPFTAYGGTSVSAIARLDLNGELLDMEDITTGFNAYPEKMAVASTNLFCVGNATIYNGVTVNNLCTITITGLLLQGAIKQIMEFPPSKGYSFKLDGSEIASLERDGTGVFQNVVVNGTLRVPTLIQSETLQVSDNLIVTRYDATVGLAAGEYTGIQATLYDGTNDGQLVFDKDGWARVGDVGNLLKLAAIEETPNDNGIAFWDSGTLKLETDSNFVYDGTNLGIGTSSPTDLLDAYSSNDNQRLLRISHPSNPTQASGFMGFSSDGVTANTVVTVGVQFSSDYYNVINIERATRNIGINKVPSLGTLDVSGTGYFSNTVTATSYNASSLPTSASGLSAGDFYTQTASQIGGSGTTKVVCVV